MLALIEFLLWLLPIGTLSWALIVFVVNQYDKGTKFGNWCHKMVQ